MAVIESIGRISNEVAAQKNLIAQIQSALEGKVASGGGMPDTITAGDTPLENNTTELQAILDAVNALPEAGGGGGGGSTITFYTGSAAPSATLGKDDDLYLQTV